MIKIDFTASINNNILTVTSIPSGTLDLNSTIQGIGVLPNTRILSFGTGTGGIGTYYLTTSQTILSSNLTANSEVTLISGQQLLDGSAVVSMYQVDVNLAPANFTASIAGTVLTVSATTSGILQVGYEVVGGGVLPDTKISSLGTGTGGIGTYNLSKSQTVGSRTLSAYTVFRFTNEKNPILNNVVWQGVTYIAYPIEVKGFELSGRGSFPRPTLKISNYAAIMSGLTKQYADLVGLKFTRKRTRLKYLDAVNFTGGVNVSADPNTYYTDDIFYINRKTIENRMHIEWELTSAMDITGIKIPRRQIIQNTCAWKYRSTECSYAGVNYFNSNDGVEVDPIQDVCGKRLSSCKLRFSGTNAILPYGGFPGAAMTL